jgi:hypothetical protein
MLRTSQRSPGAQGQGGQRASVRARINSTDGRSAGARAHAHTFGQQRSTGAAPAPGRDDGRHAAGRSIFQGGSCPPPLPPSSEQQYGRGAWGEAFLTRAGAVCAGRWRHGARACAALRHDGAHAATAPCCCRATTTARARRRPPAAAAPRAPPPTAFIRCTVAAARVGRGRG